MVGLLVFICVINTLVSLLAIYIVIKLNKYIAILEGTIEEQIDRADSLHKALQTALKQDLLLLDGSMKKPLVSKEDLE